MTMSWLRNAWSTMLVLVLAVSFNALSLTQRWGVAITWPFDVSQERRTTYQWAPVMLTIWVPATLALMILTNKLLHRRKQERPWDRIPGVYGWPTSVLNPFALRLRKLIVVGSAAFPTYVGWHLVRKMTKAIAYCDGSAVATAWYEHFTHFVSPLVAFAPGPRCLLDGIDSGVTFFPFWEPWAVLLTVSFISFAWLRALVLNIRP
jgi:hypothetical protein